LSLGGTLDGADPKAHLDRSACEDQRYEFRTARRMQVHPRHVSAAPAQRRQTPAMEYSKVIFLGSLENRVAGNKGEAGDTLEARG
jgi:hypothetical protein